VEPNAGEECNTVPQVDVEQLFKEYYGQLIWFVQRYVRDVEDAKDIVQSAFVESVRCARFFSGKSKPSTWLFGIALNLARNHVRSSCRALMAVYDDEFIEQLPDFAADPCCHAEQREIAMRVERILETLPVDIRRTFETVLEEEYSYEETALKMHIPVGTVRSRISRVRTKLRADVG
jgi:RNA polymerase sigma-70 factor (ECF subfamily)